jgi:hypothetical protein
MRLLDKKTIAVQKSEERKKEIEEGVKLAKSIDALRETHAKEQVSLKNFRDAMLRSIKEEIDTLIKQKESLKEEIKNLKCIH